MTVSERIQTIDPLYKRAVVFLGLFVLASGIIGPKIIASDLMTHAGFGLYGSIGKAVIFGLIAFGLLARHRGKAAGLHPWHRRQLAWLAAALFIYGVAWTNVDALIAGSRTVFSMVAAHGGLWLSLICAALACLGLANARIVWRQYRREIGQSVLWAGLFCAFLYGVYALWQPLAAVVMHSVNGLLGLTNITAAILQPNTLVLDKFSVTIAEYCSGVESIALFTSLYALVGLLDWRRINRRRYFALLPFALTVLFGVNILRVYGLIMGGYYINPEVAFNLFHTYAGMVFFILYSALFWAFAYSYIIDKQEI